MGLFFKKKEDPEEVAAREAAVKANEERLAAFDMTKALGVKKVQTALQFIYDEGKRQFCVVEGPAETFKDRKPIIVDYDDVEDVYLEVEEYWTEKGGKFDPHGYGILLQENYKKVFWHYNLIVHIITNNPAAKHIEFKMNTSPIIVKILGRGLMVQRGMDMNGTFRPEEMGSLATRIAELAEQQMKQFRAGEVYDMVTLKHKDEDFLKSVLEGAAKKMQEDVYIKRIENASKHIQRADKIAKMLLK